jgi:hypothetical protein
LYLEPWFGRRQVDWIETDIELPEFVFAPTVFILLFVFFCFDLLFLRLHNSVGGFKELVYWSVTVLDFLFKLIDTIFYLKPSNSHPFFNVV